MNGFSPVRSKLRNYAAMALVTLRWKIILRLFRYQMLYNHNKVQRVTTAHCCFVPQQLALQHLREADMVGQAVTRFAFHLDTTRQRLSDQIVGNVGAKATTTLIPFGGKKRVE
jgi:hypothetical protein